MKFLILLSFLLPMISLASSKEFISSYRLSQEKRWNLEQKNKNEGMVSHSIEIIMKNKKEVLAVQKKAQELASDLQFFPDYFKKEVYRLQFTGTKKNLKTFLEYLETHKVKPKKTPSKVKGS